MSASTSLSLSPWAEQLVHAEESAQVDGVGGGLEAILGLTNARPNDRNGKSGMDNSPVARSNEGASRTTDDLRGVGGIGVTDLLSDEVWREKLRTELNDRRIFESKARNDSGVKLVERFVGNTVTFVDKLGKVTTALLRIYPTSSVVAISRSLRDHLLVLSFNLALNGYTLFNTKPRFLDEDKFYEDIFRHVYGRTKVKGLENTPLYSSQYPPNEDRFTDSYTLLGMLASGMEAFSTELKDFATYMKIETNEDLTSVHNSITTFRERLKFLEASANVVPWGSLYAHDLMLSIDVHLEDVSDALAQLIENGFTFLIGLPEIEQEFKEAQKVAQTESLALLTVATLFSSVTATTLGFSFSQTSRAYQVVNFFWFLSLILSIASIMNNLLAYSYSWKHSVYRRRLLDGRQMPWLISMWSKETPLYFLVISAMTFVIGLCLFAYASKQPTWTSSMATVLTGLLALGIICATVWFSLEIYSISDLWKNFKDKFEETWGRILIRVNIEERLPWLHSAFRKAQRVVYVPWSRLRSTLEFVRRFVVLSFGRLPSLLQNTINETGDVETDLEQNTRSLLQGTEDDKDIIQSRRLDMQIRMSHLKVKLKAVMYMWPAISRNERKWNSPLEIIQDHFRDAKIIPVCDIKEAIDCLSFSPDGKLLALCKICTIYSSKSYKVLCTIVSPKSADTSFSGDVVWSPQMDDSYNWTLLITSRIGVMVYKLVGNSPAGNEPAWELDILVTPIYQWTASYQFNATQVSEVKTCVAWVPGEDAFVTVSNTGIQKFTTQATSDHLLQYDAESLKSKGGENLLTHEMAPIGGNSQARLLIAISHLDGEDKERSASDTCQIIVYDLTHFKIERRIPVFNVICSIDVSKSQRQFLVGFNDKPPQLWEVHENLSDSSFKAGPSQEYESMNDRFLMDRFMPNASGPSFFSGDEDEFVVCWARLADEFHIWDRESAVLIHTFPAWIGAGSVRCIGMNRVHVPFMFVTGAHTGELSVWKASDTIRDELVQGDGFGSIVTRALAMSRHKNDSEGDNTAFSPGDSVGPYEHIVEE